MQQVLKVVFVVLIVSLTSTIAQAKGAWGPEYFPNITLTNQDGEKVKFFDDLLKDKIVAINFIYTTCPDSCPLETAQLVKVQNIMKDRIGKDVFIYSITIDPDVDTPEKLKEYKVKWKVLNTKDFGIPQNRERIYIVGTKESFEWPKKSEVCKPLADFVDRHSTETHTLTTRHKNYIKKLNDNVVFVDFGFASFDMKKKTLEPYVVHCILSLYCT